MLASASASNAEKAQVVREYSDKAVRAEMERKIPDVPYTLLELIGKGSFGSVFRAKHNDTKQLVAIKSLDLDQHDDEIRDIQKEISLLSQISTAEAPNITAYHGSYLLGARLWVVMDLCSGGSMRTLMKAGPIEEKYIVIVIREVLVALGWLHKHGIIHRDIKAANILIGQDGNVQLCDFGVSAQLAGKGSKRTTFVGTPQWMAPEALLGAEYDWRVDIWSFGITIIEIAKQNPPLHNIQPARVVDMIPRLPPPRLEGGTWSTALRDFVAACLTENADERPSVEDLQKTKLMKAAKTPTSDMRQLLVRYQTWERGGGVRGSMLYGIGGAPIEPDGPEEGDGWDFETVKSRISGVPHEWNMGSDKETIKAPRPAPQIPPISRGTGDGLKLAQLFHDPNAPPPLRDYRMETPDNSAPSFITIPSFDNDGMQISPSGSFSSSNTTFTAPTTYSSQQSMRPPSPEPPSIGMIVMPTEEEMMEMAAKKAAATIAANKAAAEAAQAAAAAALQNPPPANLNPPNPNPPSQQVPALSSLPPLITHTGVQPYRGDPHSAFIPRGDHGAFPMSPARRDPSPRRPPVSAPSSPPRTVTQNGINNNNLSAGSKSFHLPSKSVPNITRQDPGPNNNYNPPPVPSIRQPPLKQHSMTSATPRPSGLSTSSPLVGPHGKSHSQDATIRSGQAPARSPGPIGRHKPTNLNLGPPNSNFSSGSGASCIIPPSPGRPPPIYHGGPGPINGLGLGMGLALGQAGQLPQQGSGVSGLPIELSKPGNRDGIFIFPNLPPLNTSVLMGKSGKEDFLHEMERLVVGLDEGLGAVQNGLKHLRKAKSKDVESVPEGDE